MDSADTYFYYSDAIACGCEYIGMQDRPNKPSIPLFQDNKTGTSFTLHGNETVAEAVDRVRREWEAQQ